MRYLFNKNTLISCLFLFLIFTGSASAGTTFKDKFKAGLQSTGTATGHIDESGVNTSFLGNRTLPEAIGYVVGIALSFIGVVFLVLLIYGGYIWMFARGNDQEVEKAKNIITNSIIGIIVILLAYALTAFLADTVAAYIYAG